VDKPPGVLTVPGRGEDPSTSLWRRLEQDRGERLWVVHRLDRETSGVLVLARTAEAHRQGSVAFEKGQVEKEYLAFAHGVPSASVIQEPLLVGERGRVSVAPAGQKGAKAALTRVSVVRRWPQHGVSLVKCLPATGRQHQIRVHLAHVGAPLLCDALYGERESPWPMSRVALHAQRLVVPPSWGGHELVAPLPEDFVATLRALDGV
jgi:tRNA pseudouridine32 synthase/23S rRNA pseudouridine746 synthase